MARIACQYKEANGYILLIVRSFADDHPPIMSIGVAAPRVHVPDIHISSFVTHGIYLVGFVKSPLCNPSSMYRGGLESGDNVIFFVEYKS